LRRAVAVEHDARETNHAVTRPRVQIGDHLVLPPRVVDGCVRMAVVVDVLGEDGSPPFVLRWEDGSETVVYPSSAAYVVRRGSDDDDCHSE